MTKRIYVPISDDAIKAVKTLARDKKWSMAKAGAFIIDDYAGRTYFEAGDLLVIGERYMVEIAGETEDGILVTDSKTQFVVKPEEIKHHYKKNWNFVPIPAANLTAILNDSKIDLPNATKKES